MEPCENFGKVTEQFVIFDNGQKIHVEQVLSNPDSDYTFIVVRDADGSPRAMLLDNVVITVTEWAR